jgi:hypothetical protein
MAENNNRFEDKVLICLDCGDSFLFNAGEQTYFKSKGLSQPKRCRACRQKRRATLVPDPGERAP